MQRSEPLPPRINETAERLVVEFQDSTPPEMVRDLLTEFVSSLSDARIDDFVPLLVYRYARERLLATQK